MDDCYTLQVEATFRSVSEVRCSILSSYFRETKMYPAQPVNRLSVWGKGEKITREGRKRVRACPQAKMYPSPHGCVLSSYDP